MEENAISDINYLVERMEKLLTDAWRIPMSTYQIINEDEFLDVIDQIRTAIPKEMKQAERILQERDRILAQAEDEAERIVQQAREDAAKLAEEHEIAVAASQRAETIVDRARRDAEVLKGEADEYARGVLVDLNGQLGGLETQITKLIGIVQNGLAKLSTVRPAAADEQAQPATPTQ